MCERYNAAPETALHALWSRPILDEIWLNTSLWSYRKENAFADFKELVKWVLQNNVDAKMFAMIVWSIWSQRNQIRTQQAYCSLHQLAQLANEQQQEFLAVQPPPKLKTPRQRAQWSPPTPGLIKINFDRTIFQEANKSRIGVVIRNSQGLILASLSRLLPQAYTVVEVEALAVARALQFAAELDFKEAILEGDSEIIIKALKDKESSLTTHGLFIQDAKFISMSFTQLRYSHTRREGNMFAHSLAKYAANIVDYVVWMKDAAPQIHNVIQADFATFE